MRMKKTKDAKIIDALGGTGAVAKMLRVKSPSVSIWKKQGIPEARRQTIALLRPDLCPKSWAPVTE